MEHGDDAPLPAEMVERLARCPGVESEQLDAGLVGVGDDLRSYLQALLRSGAYYQRLRLGGKCFRQIIQLKQVAGLPPPARPDPVFENDKIICIPITVDEDLSEAEPFDPDRAPVRRRVASCLTHSLTSSLPPRVAGKAFSARSPCVLLTILP